MGVDNFFLSDVQGFDYVASTFLTQYYLNRQINKKIVLPMQIVDNEELSSYLSQKSGQNVELIVFL